MGLSVGVGLGVTLTPSWFQGVGLGRGVWNVCGTGVEVEAGADAYDGTCCGGVGLGAMVSAVAGDGAGASVGVGEGVDVGAGIGVGVGLIIEDMDETGPCA